MRIGKLEKKILLTLVRSGACTIKELAKHIEGINDLSETRASSFYRSLKNLKEKGFVIEKLRLVYVDEDDSHYYDLVFADGKWWYNRYGRSGYDPYRGNHSPFCLEKTLSYREYDDDEKDLRRGKGGHFHRFGLTVSGRKRALELRNELLAFKEEWSKFLPLG